MPPLTRRLRGRTRAIGGIVALLVLAGCANRPTTDDLTNSIILAAEADPTVTLTAEQARCMADWLINSDLSDTTLDGLAANFDEPEVLSAEVNRIEPAVADAAASCIGAG